MHLPVLYRPRLSARAQARMAQALPDFSPIVKTRPLEVLSLGAGVQSSKLYLAAARGDYGTIPDVAVNADTGAEPQKVYDWIDYLEQQAGRIIPIVQCSAGNIRTSIYDAQSTGKRYASIPLFVRKADGTQGIGRRQCTSEYKIQPQITAMRLMLGMKPKQQAPYTLHPKTRKRVYRILVRQWFGISVDELYRVKDSRTPWIQNTYPLIDQSEDRNDCQRWIVANGHPPAPKSACIICPYTEDERWRDMKENRPLEFADAVQFDREVRSGGPRGVLWGQNFLHRSCLPLDEVDFSTPSEKGYGDLGFADECEGMCGV
jgi:hypothetical protein